MSAPVSSIDNTGTLHICVSQFRPLVQLVLIYFPFISRQWQARSLAASHSILTRPHSLTSCTGQSDRRRCRTSAVKVSVNSQHNWVWLLDDIQGVPKNGTHVLNLR